MPEYDDPTSGMFGAPMVPGMQNPVIPPNPVKQQDPFAAILAFLQSQQQAQQNQPNQMQALIQAINAPRGQHLGIGGQPITNDNPMGHAGGDPWKNGFFKPQVPQAPMDILSGSPMPSPDQMGLLQQSRAAQITPGIPMPEGDPMARAFWANGGMTPQPLISPMMFPTMDQMNPMAKPKSKKPGQGAVNFGTNRPAFSF